jgi:hypothetical protein
MWLKDCFNANDGKPFLYYAASYNSDQLCRPNGVATLNLADSCTQDRYICLNFVHKLSTEQTIYHVTLDVRRTHITSFKDVVM